MDPVFEILLIATLFLINLLGGTLGETNALSKINLLIAGGLFVQLVNVISGV